MEIEKGFYYHYKHDPNGDVNNFAYEVVGFGMHTEMHDDPNGVMVIYRPLYEAFVYKKGKWFDVRPLNMFKENVTKDGKTFPRFQKVTDSDTIQKLVDIRDQMYGTL
ncbi:MAG: DUF1653 domain-containing protein [Candidatus Pacebacteria bacterium]|nr:DUF1653 domain-containing protein [Candidatus Paceibacterota bacterium]